MYHRRNNKSTKGVTTNTDNLRPGELIYVYFYFLTKTLTI